MDLLIGLKGDCKKQASEVNKILADLMPRWNGQGYNVLKHNCCSFCNEFSELLGTGPIPKWVHRLADAGAELVDEIESAVHSLHAFEEEIKHETEVVRILSNDQSHSCRRELSFAVSIGVANSRCLSPKLCPPGS